jgi:surface antigen
MKRRGRFKTFLLHRLIPSLIVSIMVIILVVIGFNFLNKPTTYADNIQPSDLDYPWPTDMQAPCMYGTKGGPSCINPSDPKNENDWYEWGVYNNSTGKFQIYRNGGYGNGAYEYRNCTDYVAWKVESLGGHVGNLGNGGQWYKNSPASEQSLIPQKWDAAVEPGAIGHVAFVESVNSIDSSNPGNDNITVSEYNENGDGHGEYRTGTAASMGFTEFVNFGISPKSTITQTNNPNPANYAKK